MVPNNHDAPVVHNLNVYKHDPHDPQTTLYTEPFNTHKHCQATHDQQLTTSGVERTLSIHLAGRDNYP